VPTGVEGEKVGTKEGRRRQDPAVAASKPEPVPSARRDKPSTRAARVGYQRWWWWEKANCTGIPHTGQGRSQLHTSGCSTPPRRPSATGRRELGFDLDWIEMQGVIDPWSGFLRDQAADRHGAGIRQRDERDM
jgi:hypothetical protein